MTQLPSQNNSGLISIKEAADILGYSTKSLRRWEKTGLLTAKRTLGGHRRYALESISELKQKISRHELKKMPEVIVIEKVRTEVRIPTQLPIKIISPKPARQEYTIPLLYSSLHSDQKRILIGIGSFFVLAMMFLLEIKFVPPQIKQELASFVSGNSSLLGMNFTDETISDNSKGTVLQAAITPPTFTVNIDALFNKDVEIKGDLILDNALVVPSLESTGAITSGSTITAGTNLISNGDLAVNGGDITSTQTTFNLLNTNVTTLNLGGAATAVSLGATSGTTTIKNAFNVDGATTLDGSLTVGGSTTLGTTTTGALTASSITDSGALSVSGTSTLAAITASGDLTLSNTATFNIGGSGSTGDYNIIGDSISAASATMNSDDDLYIEGNLEVDGSIIGTLSGSFNPGLTEGAVLFQGSTGISGDATNFLWDDSNNQLEIGPGATIIPSVDLGADLGSASFRWNNIYAANLTIDSGFTSTGQLLVTYNPTDTTFAQSSIRVNVTTPASDEQMLGIGQAGEERATIDAEGDLTLGYDGAAGSSTPTTSNPFMVYGHSTTNVASIDTSGSLILAGDLSVQGATTLGDASGDTLTANAATWTFVNDTDFALSGGVNGLSLDGTTFSVDATSNRIGIGTASPDAALEVEGASIHIDSTANSNLIIDRAGTNNLGSVTYQTAGSNSWFSGLPDSDIIGAGTEYFIGTSNGDFKFWIETTGNTGIGSSSPDAALEINHATGDSLRLTYNDSDGSATAYTDFSLASDGDLTIDSAGDNITTPDDLAINGGDLTSTATTFNFDIGNTGTLNFRDGSNTLLSITDAGTQGSVYATGQLRIGNFSGAPTSIGAGAFYYNTTDNEVYYNNSVGWVSLNPVKADKNSLHAIYRSLSSVYDGSNITSQYQNYESIARGIFFDNLTDGTKVDSANQTAAVDLTKHKTGLWGGVTMNATNTDTDGNTFLGSADANDTYYYDTDQTGKLNSNQDSEPQTLVDLGVDPNWKNGVSLVNATESGTLVSVPPANLSTTYNGGLVKVTGRYATSEEDGGILITILSDNEATASGSPNITFNWKTLNDPLSPAHSGSNIILNKGESYTLETGTNDLTVTFQRAMYHAGDMFKVASWYLEPQTTNDRGEKQSFPDHAYLVAQGAYLDILDADTNKHWMRFQQNTDYALGVDANNDPSSTHAMNGTVLVGTNGSASTGVYEIDFPQDTIYRYNTTAKFIFYGKGIQDRNTDPGDGYHADKSITALAISDNAANDVHVNTVPNRPTRETTINGWGYVDESAAGTISETVYLPAKFINPPIITTNFASRSSGATPTSLANCDTTIQNSPTTETSDVTSNSFLIILNKATNWVAGDFACYTWIATGVIAPQQVFAVAGDSGLDVVNESNPIQTNFADDTTDDYDNVWVTSGGKLYGVNETKEQLEKWTNSAVNPEVGDRTTPDKIWDDTATNFPAISGSTIGTVSNATPANLYVTEGTSTMDNSSDTVYIGLDTGLAKVETFDQNANINDGNTDRNGSVKYYTKDYITEEQIEEIRTTLPLYHSSVAANTTITAADASITQNAFTTDETASLPTVSASGVRGDGFSFDGGDYICTGTTGTCADDGDLDFIAADNFAVGAWVKETDTAATDVILGKTDVSGGNPTVGYQLYVGADGKPCLGVDDDATSFPEASACGTSPVDDNQWHFIVGTKTGTTDLRLYVDGIQVGIDNTSIPSGTLANAGSFRVGINADLSSNGFNGTIDEIFVVNQLPTLSQIKSMYESGKRALQSHGVNDFKNNLSEGGTAAGAQSTVTAIGVQVPQSNADGFGPYAYVASNDAGTDGFINKIDVGSDTSVQTFTSTTDPAVADDDTTVLSVSPSGLEIAGANSVGARSPGFSAEGNDTSGIYQSETTVLPENITSVYLWLNTWTDADDGGSSITVQASNDGGSNYASCSSTNSDTNQPLPEKEYVCKFIAADNDLKVKLTFARTDNDPNIYITQYGVGWSGSGADLAENYVTDELDVQIGDVVRIKDGGINTLVGKTTKPYDESLIGIVSARPGTVLGPEDGSTPGYDSTDTNGTASGPTKTIPVALSGRVPVRVSTESGVIKKGDYLTSSSTPGIAMKAVRGGKTVGQALEDQQEGQDRVLTFVGNGFYLGNLGADGSIQLDDELTRRILGIKDANPDGLDTDPEATESALPKLTVAEAIGKLIERLETVENDISFLKSDQLIRGGISPASSVTTDSTSQTLLSTADLVVTGGANIGNLSLESDSINSIGALKIQSLALGNIEFQNNSIEIDTEGNLSIKEGKIIGNSNFRDTATISTGQNILNISRSWDTAPLTIVVTPNYDTYVWVENVSKDGFTIRVKNPPAGEQKVYWQAIW